MTLTRGAAVKATLVRQGDGQAPRSARVRITNNGRQFLRTVDLSDGFVVSGLRGGSVRLSIQANGAQPYDTGTMQVPDGDVLDLGIITLPSGFAVRGTIVDDRGAPLPGARIRLLRTNGDSPALAHVLGNWTEAASADDGTFQLGGLEAGSQFVVVEARGFAQRVIPDVAVSEERATFDAGTVPLEPGRTIELSCRPQNRCGTEASILIAGADYPFLAVKAPLRQGRGTFNAVPSGTATLRLTRNQHVTHERSVTVEPGNEAATLQVELPSVRVRGDVTIGSRRARDGSLLFTRAVRAAGLPIMINGATENGTTIEKQWLGSFGASTACELAQNGEFVLDEMDPGLYDVVFRSNGASTTSVQIAMPDVPDHHLPLRFEGAEIAGRVVDTENPPRGGAHRSRRCRRRIARDEQRPGRPVPPARPERGGRSHRSQRRRTKSRGGGGDRQRRRSRRRAAAGGRSERGAHRRRIATDRRSCRECRGWSPWPCISRAEDGRSPAAGPASRRGSCCPRVPARSSPARTQSAKRRSLRRTDSRSIACFPWSASRRASAPVRHSVCPACRPAPTT